MIRRVTKHRSQQIYTRTTKAEEAAEAAEAAAAASGKDKEKKWFGFLTVLFLSKKV